jgi:hypothetical protein
MPSWRIATLGDSVHEDSHRFINDLEGWYGKEIIRCAPKNIQISMKFSSIGNI